MKKIAILGAGAMGTALTTPLISNGHEVRLWGTELDTSLLTTMRAGQAHPRIGIQIDQRVQLYDPAELSLALEGADIVVLAITSDAVTHILQRAVPYLSIHRPLVMVTKGFGHNKEGSVCLLPPLLQATLPADMQDAVPIVAVGGPCKANEVATGWPTATIYGSTDRDTLEACLAAFQTAQYRILPTPDVIGLEVAAALKNVYAIALGICNGLEEVTHHPWHNLKAALFSQAVAEMAALAEALGGQPVTAYGLAGAGDLEVTALSGRNRLLGERLGRGESITSALESMRKAEQTVEGVAATYHAVELISQYEANSSLSASNYPLLHTIHTILEGKVDTGYEAGLAALLAEAALPTLRSPITS